MRALLLPLIILMLFHCVSVIAKIKEVPPKPTFTQIVATPHAGVTPFPVVTSQSDYDAVPVGGSYWFNGHLQEKRYWGEPTPTPKPIESTPTQVLGSSAQYPIVLDSKTDRATIPNETWVVDSLGRPWMWQSNSSANKVSVTAPPPFPFSGRITFLALATILIFIISMIKIGSNPKTKPKPEPEPAKPGASHKKAGQIYSDYEQFKLATQVWSRDQQLFETNESARLASLAEESSKKGGPLTVIGVVVLAAVVFFVVRANGVGAGFWTGFLGLSAVGGLMSVDDKIRRRRNKALFSRREFDQLEPIFQPPKTPPPRNDPEQEQRRQEPPPRQEAPSPPPKTDEIRVTSLKQAFEILGLPPGKITLSVAQAAYKARMLEYHPDRVAHLGTELRELAERKAKLINLAWHYVQQNCR
jgi:hypothetical protein